MPIKIKIKNLEQKKVNNEYMIPESMPSPKLIQGLIKMIWIYYITRYMFQWHLKVKGWTDECRLKDELI